MDKANRYKLDNVGKFYSAESTGPWQTVFRFSAEFVDEVNPEVLQKALEHTIERFPGFNVCLRNGAFWHHLEPAASIPQVQPESIPACFRLHTGPNSTLFRVSYFRNRANLEVSHIISDGRGTLGFFRVLVQSYVEEQYGASCASMKHISYDSPQYNEDGFHKHYEPHKAGSTPTRRAYRIRGLRDRNNPTYMEYHLSASEVLEVAHKFDVSITSLMIAAVINAIRATMPSNALKRPIRLTVPVDLRQFFETDTMRNFFGLVTISYMPHHELEPLEEVAQLVQLQLSEAAQPEQLERRMNRMTALEKNPFLHIAPLFLKDWVLNFAARVSARDITSAVSNLGQLTFDECTDGHIKSVNVLTSTNDLNFVICTFGNDLSVGISTIFKNLDIVHEFCRIFSNLGIYGHVNMNKPDGELCETIKET
ncbi:alcohol acetyltransferase [Adlercreutzia sp. ZJ154]|uniref:alcohol acetyltransferase n=1 Tax=Adlercreutzia sp. ZJ154 TaxID=2709790 RepID=UPI0013EDD178|nr:alcohol acetyltransferase [Adlercreutzia sp. ZJ154]